MVFLIEFHNGTPRVRQGRPPAGFLSACADIARLYGIRSGRIRCIRAMGTQQLRFSRDIPERARQPLRNVWTPPPTGGPPGRRAWG